ncbi:MAG: ArsC family reductase [Bdellovibrionales bacterium]|nr:ArsC family reductase [Ramlibacter sp.]
MSKHTITLYGIPNCDTVKKARAWLTSHGIDYRFHDFKKQGAPESQIDSWLDKVGWDKLVNRQGTTWRKLEPATQIRVTDGASARALMLEQTSIIKRPVVEWKDDNVTVGFDAPSWALLANKL